jgi:hypothetical protein
MATFPYLRLMTVTDDPTALAVVRAASSVARHWT